MYSQDNIDPTDPVDVDNAWKGAELANALAEINVPITLSRNGFGIRLYLAGTPVATLKAGVKRIRVPDNKIPAAMLMVLRQHRAVLMLDKEGVQLGCGTARAVFLDDARYSLRLCTLVPRSKAQQAVLG